MTDPATQDSRLTPTSAADSHGLGTIDAVAAIHVHNQARHASRVLDAVAEGLGKVAAERRVAMLVADAGSEDGTRDVLLAWGQATAPGVPCRVLELPRPISRGRVVLELLAAARAAGARACALVDADLIAFPAAWIESLLAPLLRGEADYVSPVYSRSITEGTLTTNVLAPLTRALYGVRIQQLAGGCAGVGGDFVHRWLDGAPASRERSAQGMEMALATEAVASGARIVEVHLGRKPVDPAAAQPDLAATIVRTVGPLFALMERHYEAWRDVRGSAAPPLLGDPVEEPADSGHPLRVERMVDAFRLGLKDLLQVWEQILPEPTLSQLYPLGLLAADEFQMPPGLWARIVSDFAIAHHQRHLPHDHVLRALTPLYLGRVAAFLGEARARPLVRVRDLLETVARAFDAEKEYLVARWR